MIKNLFNLLFPETCGSCGLNLNKNEEVICTSCIAILPTTKYWNDIENKVAKKLWGRVKLEHTSSYLHFIKEGMVQQMLHQLKYKGMKNIGLKLGNLYAQELQTLEVIKQVDLIIPVPMYHSKEKQRGFNQSLLIAEGISEVLAKPIDKEHLIKVKSTGSQTKLNRWNRWLNQNEKFELTNTHIFENKHILMVDDVITTGATVEACVSLLNNIPNCTVSAVFLASAL